MKQSLSLPAPRITRSVSWNYPKLIHRVSLNAYNVLCARSIRTPLGRKPPTTPEQIRRDIAERNYVNVCKWREKLTRAKERNANPMKEHMDLDYARRLRPEFSDKALEAGMHKARYELLQCSRESRHTSGAWLRAACRYYQKGNCHSDEK